MCVLIGRRCVSFVLFGACLAWSVLAIGGLQRDASVAWAAPASIMNLIPTRRDISAGIVVEPAHDEPAPGAIASQVTPVGVVFTTRQERMPDGDYQFTICLANLGEADVHAVDVAFTLTQPEAAFVSLHTPTSFNEVGGAHARTIIERIRPGHTVQIAVRIRSARALREDQPQVVVPRAFPLAADSPAVACVPAEALPSAADPTADPAPFFTEGSEQRAGAAPLASVSNTPLTDVAHAPALSDGTRLSADGLMLVAVLVGVLVLALVVLLVWRVRRRDSFSER